MADNVLLTIEQVIAKFPDEVRERYDFSDAVYHGALERMTQVRCREHGFFSQYPAQLRRGGSGCPACGDKVRRSKQRLTQEEAIAKATALHDGFYDYSKTVYTTGHSKMTVTCPLHGDFETLASNHIYGGKGCPTCGAAKRGHRKNLGESARKTADTKLAKARDEFETQARELHGDAYDYSRVEYKGRREKVTIVCPDHGPFEQTPMHHLYRTAWLSGMLAPYQDRAALEVRMAAQEDTGSHPPDRRG